jgi:hypothetical protein
MAGAQGGFTPQGFLSYLLGILGGGGNAANGGYGIQTTPLGYTQYNNPTQNLLNGASTDPNSAAMLALMLNSYMNPTQGNVGQVLGGQ